MEVIKGSNLKLLLKKKGITQKFLSESLGIHMTTISRYFTDDVAMPATFVLRVAVLADFQIEDLVKYHKSEKLILVANETQAEYKTEVKKDVDSIKVDDLGKVIRDIQTSIVEMKKEIKRLKQNELHGV
jgi:transcriptional regulator with XRE-family HTH domain